jgi:hypothetical protein
MPYCYRHRLADPGLYASVRQFGILTPLIVSDDKRPAVIAGHRRLHAARALKIREVPVLVMRQGDSPPGAFKGTVPFDPRDAFLLNLVSNWKQTCSDADRARALGLASREFGFGESEMLSQVMPLLGLPEDRGMLGVYLKVDQFPPALKDLLEDGQMPLRGVTFLLKFSKKDQEYFAQRIAAKARLTSSQLLQSGEWLADIMKGTGKDLRALCEEHKLLEGFGARGMDPRTQADKFFARVRQLRFPGYSYYLETFDERRADILRDAREIRLEPVQGFEEPGFELQARVKSPQELDRLLRKLSEKRAALNSLFEIAL